MKIIDHEAKSFRYTPRKGTYALKWFGIGSLAVADTLGILIVVDSAWASTHNQLLFNTFLVTLIMGLGVLAFTIIPSVRLKHRMKAWSQRNHALTPVGNHFGDKNLSWTDGVKTVAFRQHKNANNEVNWYKVTTDYGNAAKNAKAKDSIVIVKLQNHPFSKEECLKLVNKEKVS